jgi:hypothetical protein
MPLTGSAAGPVRTLRLSPLVSLKAEELMAGESGELGFPDIPRLELDQLLVQLADRADDVRATQGRLRGLLRANALVAGELSLPVVLRQIVGAARDLLGARYAALGVLGPDGSSSCTPAWTRR